MLIYNREEVENSFKTKDNEILQIESIFPLREFTQKLKDGSLQPEEFEAHLFRAGVERQIAYQETSTQARDDTLYTHIFDPESEDGMDNQVQKRHPLFEEFERFTYGQNHDFIEVPIRLSEEQDEQELQGNREFVLHSCYDALGIMPTLYEEEVSRDLSVKEMRDMSYEGMNLYFPWEDLTLSNRLPQAEDLKMFHSLTPYEKAVLLDTNYNPTRILDLLHGLKSIKGQEQTIITSTMANQLVNHGNMNNELFLDAFWAGQGVYRALQDNPPADYKALEEAFKKAYNRPPRVLPEIYDAYKKAMQKTGLADAFTEEEISRIVKEFSLNNVKKVAAMHNEALLLLSGKYNFDTMKKEHLQIFATYITPQTFPILETNGFFEWYEKYKGQIKTSDLHTLMRRDPSTIRFHLNLTPAELLSLDSQIRGWCNAACVYQQYGIDFRQAVVAIPNRGLVVEDKSQHIRMHILDSKDARVFTVGQDCRCCQNLAIYGDPTYGLSYRAGEITQELLEQHFTSIDEAYAYVAEHFADNHHLISPGVGGSCVANELTNPLCWVTIWEDSITGDTIAQADTHYIPATNTLVFDNIEHVNDGNVAKIYDVTAKFAEESTFDAIHVGVGCNGQMKNFGHRISTTQMQHYTTDVTPQYQEHFGSSVYSDYHSDAMKIKQNGKMEIFPKKADSCFKVERHPEDNEQFKYLLHPLASLFYQYSPEQKQDLITRYDQQNLTADEMLTVAKKAPELLKDIETLPLAVQRAILYPEQANRSRSRTQAQNGMEMSNFKYIRHPDSLLLDEALHQSPSSILYFDSNIVTKAHWMYVLEKDGSLIEYCPLAMRDEELLTVAIKNNPYSIKYIAQDLTGDLRDKMIRLAVFKKPILTAHFPDLPEYVWVKICENKGQFGKFCTNQTYRVQKAMITSSPYNIDYIKNPDRRIVMEVAEKIRSLRWNPRYKDYFEGSANYPDHRSNRREFASETARPQQESPMMNFDRVMPVQTSHSTDLEDVFDLS